MVRAFVSIGSNIDPEKNMLAAVRRLEQRTRVVGISMVYRSEALGRPEQPQYLNCVVAIETEVAPLRVKQDILRPIEDALGRQRSADKYAPRTIDLDLIVYDNLRLDADGLRLPDPQILERPFLAVPLLELAPDLVLPGFDQAIAAVAARLPSGGMAPLEDYARLLRRHASQGRQQDHSDYPVSDREDTGK